MDRGERGRGTRGAADLGALRKTSRFCYLFIHNTTCSQPERCGIARTHAHTPSGRIQPPRFEPRAHIDVEPLRYFTAISVMNLDLLWPRNAARKIYFIDKTY